MKSHKFFFFLFLFGLISLQLINFGSCAEYIVSYQEYNTSGNELIYSQSNPNLIEKSNYASINFNLPNTTDLLTDFPNFASTTNPCNFSIEEIVFPSGSTPATYYRTNALKINASADCYPEINHRFSSDINLSAKNSKSQFVGFEYGFSLSSRVNYTEVRFYHNSTTYLRIYFDFDGQDVGVFKQPYQLLGFYGNILPLKSNFAFSRLLLIFYINGSLRVTANFYDSEGISLTPPLDPNPYFGATITDTNFTLIHNIDRIHLFQHFLTSVPDSFYIYYIESSHFITVTNEELIPQLTDFISNDYFKLFYNRYNNTNIENVLNTTGLTDYSKTGQIMFYKDFDNPYSYRKYTTKTVNSTILTNNSYVYSDILDNIQNKMILKSNLEMNLNSFLRLEFVNHNVSIIYNSTDLCIQSDNEKISLPYRFLNIQIKYIYSRLEIIVISDTNQYVFNELITDKPLLNIVFNNTNLASLEIKQTTTLTSVSSDEYYYIDNYIIDELTEEIDVFLPDHIIGFDFPIIDYPIDQVVYDGKNYYPYIIFITRVESIISANNSFSGYYSENTFYHFLHIHNDSYTYYNDTFYSEFWFVNKLPNGGYWELVINLFDNATDYTALSYDITLTYAIIFSTDIGFDTYFTTGLTLLLPIVILSIFAYGMYAESKSKFLLGFGILLGVVILYLVGMISLTAMIMFLALTIIMLMVFIKKEKRSNEND